MFTGCLEPSYSLLAKAFSWCSWYMVNADMKGRGYHGFWVDGIVITRENKKRLGWQNLVQDISRTCHEGEVKEDQHECWELLNMSSSEVVKKSTMAMSDL
ncbi:hypothetical protein ACSQ67_025880 [Phaseolus vulgaris]